NMNIVRSLNRELGSPVNRLNIMGSWAVSGLGSDWSNWGGNAKILEERRNANHYSNEKGVHYNMSSSSQNSLMRIMPLENLTSLLRQLSFVLKSRFNYLLFHGTLFVISLGFYLTSVKERIGSWLRNEDGRGTQGFEELLDDQMKRSLEENFGMALDQRIFEG
ncbi:12965_t:CDS:1, partial [Acaulospora morrowiae]